MGVGKTSAGQCLKRLLPHAVYLDGDWCWDADPFLVTEETKAVVMDNICHVLNNFLRCSAYENVIFTWVMHEQSIIDALRFRLETPAAEVKAISLICSANALKARLGKDIGAGLRQPDILTRSLARLPLYARLDTVKLDVSALAPEDVALRISLL